MPQILKILKSIFLNFLASNKTKIQLFPFQLALVIHFLLRKVFGFSTSIVASYALLILISSNCLEVSMSGRELKSTNAHLLF